MLLPPVNRQDSAKVVLPNLLAQALLQLLAGDHGFVDAKLIVS